MRLISLRVFYVFASESNWMNDDVKPFAHNNQKRGGEVTANPWENKENWWETFFQLNEEYNIKMFLRNKTFQPQ